MRVWSTSGAFGVCVKSKAFIRSFACPSCAAGSSDDSDGVPNTFSMNFGIDACSDCSLKMKPGFAQGEMMMSGSRKPSP